MKRKKLLRAVSVLTAMIMLIAAMGVIPAVAAEPAIPEEPPVPEIVADGSVKLIAASLALGTEIDISYYVQISGGYQLAEGEKLSMRFTVGEDQPIAAEPAQSGGYYVFKLSGISPLRISENIKAEVLFTDGVSGREYVAAAKEAYSVRENCEKLLSMTAEQLGMSAEKYAAMEQLVSDLIVYSDAAMIYRNNGAVAIPYNEDGVELKSSSHLPTSEDAMKLEQSQLDELYLKSAKVFFGTTNYISMKLFSAVEDPSRVTVRLDGTVYALTELDALGDGIYEIKAPGLCVTEYGLRHVLELMLDGEVCATLEYSVNSYSYSMVNGGTSNELMKTLALAMYRYGVSAKNYSIM